MEEQLRATRLVADFFTQRYRISGGLDVGHHKLADQLDDQTTAFVQIQDAYVSNIEHPAEIVASHTTSILRKSKIVAVVVARQEDGLRRQRSYGSYLGAYLERVFLIVPGYQVQGYLHLSSKFDLRRVLTSGTDYFVSALDGQLAYSARPEISFSGGAILINKSHIEAFWVEEEHEEKEEASHGQDSGN